ncbi:hypothetical protein ACQ4PT_038055 [Festuca glaucescens]
MDPSSSYLLKIRLLGNRNKARKEIKCFCFEKIVDSDLTNYKDLVASILDQYPPRYLEVAHAQYYDDVQKTFPEIKSDQELMSIFEKHAKTKMLQMFFAYCDPHEPYEPITEYYSDVHIHPNNNTEQDDDGYLCNPIPENEHIGIDEENMYLEKEPTALNVVLFSDKEKDKDYVADDESKDESDDEREDVTELEEEEELQEENHAPNVEYDKEDPPMTEASTYPNMDEFKLALYQHAIKHEFEYNTEKSTPYRFRGYCKRRDEDNCPWRIHASTTDDMCTIEAIAGRPKTERYKGCGEKKRKNGKHLCPICKEYGHHWHNCKKGNPEDIAAMLAVREPPKKRTKTAKTAESSILPCEDGAPTRMCFPPSQCLETTTKKKGKLANSSAGASKSKCLENTSNKKGKWDNSESVRSKRSRSGSNQPEPMAIEFPMGGDETNFPVKAKGKSNKKRCAEKIPMVPLDSPAMCTRSKNLNPGSPAMSTRSKRRLSL